MSFARAALAALKSSRTPSITHPQVYTGPLHSASMQANSHTNQALAVYKSFARNFRQGASFFPTPQEAATAGLRASVGKPVTRSPAALARQKPNVLHPPARTLLGNTIAATRRAFATEWKLAQRELRGSGQGAAAARAAGSTAARAAHSGTQALHTAAAPTSLSGAVLDAARANPFTFGVLVATVKTLFSDLLVQAKIEGRDEVDWVRIKLFTLFGFVYLGVFQWFLYVTVFKRLFPGMVEFGNQSLRDKLRNREGMKALFGQVALDNFLHYPFIYYPVFYIFKEGVSAKEDDLATLGTLLGGGLGKYRENMVDDNLAIWSIWVPGDMVVYAVPVWMRLPLNHGISFVWTCILSFMRGGETTAHIEAAVENTQ